MNELPKSAGLLSSANLTLFRSVMLRLMDTHRINATELARRINLPQPTVHRLVVGKTEDPKLSTLLSIADYFSITLDQLLGNAAITELDDSVVISRTMSVPVISWQHALQPEAILESLTAMNWSDWLVLDMQASTHTFGLRSKPVMEPRFSTGSVLVVDPAEAPQDGNIVIVHYANTNEATIREIILDGPKKLLRSITHENEVDELINGIVVVGVVIQTRYNYKQ